MTVLEIPNGYLIRFLHGEEIFSGLIAFAEKQGITAAWVQGLGALSRAVIGFFDMESRGYLRHEVAEEVELSALTGNIGLVDGKPFPHLHVTLSRKNATELGGHLFEGHTGATVELWITNFPGTRLERKPDELTGLNLWSLPKEFAPAS